MNFAQQLSKLMDSRALTNYQLAKDLDIHPTTVANWLAGKTPRKKTLAILSDYFGVSVDYLWEMKRLPLHTKMMTNSMKCWKMCAVILNCALCFDNKKATPEQVRQYIKVIKALRGGDDDE